MSAIVASSTWNGRAAGVLVCALWAAVWSAGRTAESSPADRPARRNLFDLEWCGMMGAVCHDGRKTAPDRNVERIRRRHSCRQLATDTGAHPRHGRIPAVSCFSRTLLLVPSTPIAA